MSSRFRSGFTLMETLVLVGILVVLLSIFIPYVSSIRETSKRIACANNLRQVRNALSEYANDNAHDFPRVRFDPASLGYHAFTGVDDPNPFAAATTVAPNDVTASLWLLVRSKYITDLSLFVCPSGSGARDWFYDARDQKVEATKRSNFRTPANLSYSYASPFSGSSKYRLNSDFVPWDFAVLADQNPGASAAEASFDAGVVAITRANSPNHGGAGQNVVYGDGHGEFKKTPYCGVGYSTVPPGDNIYTARGMAPTTQPTSLPARSNGAVARNAEPTGDDDSYLVPTAQDVADVYIAATQPATTRATQ